MWCGLEVFGNGRWYGRVDDPCGLVGAMYIAVLSVLCSIPADQHVVIRSCYKSALASLGSISTHRRIRSAGRPFRNSIQVLCEHRVAMVQFQPVDKDIVYNNLILNSLIRQAGQVVMVPLSHFVFFEERIFLENATSGAQVFGDPRDYCRKLVRESLRKVESCSATRTAFEKKSDGHS